MLATLAVGLASGVGLCRLALFATVFILGVLWVIESFEPKAKKPSADREGQESGRDQEKNRSTPGRSRVEWSVRAAGDDQLVYEVHLPFDKKTDRITAAMLKLDPENVWPWSGTRKKRRSN